MIIDLVTVAALLLATNILATVTSHGVTNRQQPPTTEEKK